MGNSCTSQDMSFDSMERMERMVTSKQKSDARKQYEPSPIQKTNIELEECLMDGQIHFSHDSMVSSGTQSIQLLKTFQDAKDEKDKNVQRSKKLSISYPIFFKHQVADYGAYADQNPRYKSFMEDEHIIIDSKNCSSLDLPDNYQSKNLFFAVYDGHGGTYCSKYAVKNLHERLFATIRRKKRQALALAARKGRQTSSSCSSHFENFKSISKGSVKKTPIDKDEALTPKEMKECFIYAYECIDEELAAYEEADECGTTAVTCIIELRDDNPRIHVANVGDSRAILCSNGVAHRMTRDHKTEDRREKKRIRDRGGMIINCRVGGTIRVTRALGDEIEKDFVISKPHVVTHEISPLDSFLVLISDGVSDAMSDQKVVEIVQKSLYQGNSATATAKVLIDKAKQMGTTDNLTAIVIEL